MQSFKEGIQGQSVVAQTTSSVRQLLFFKAEPSLTTHSLIFYDKAGKTGGVAAKAFDYGTHVDLAIVVFISLRLLVSSLVHDAFKTVENCICEQGCVNCKQVLLCTGRVYTPKSRCTQSILQGTQRGLIETGGSGCLTRHSWFIN